MRTLIDTYKGQKIWIDEGGQFWTGEEDSKHFWNPGTSVQHIKEEIDFLEAWENASQIKVIRIEYPHLQVWNIRNVTTVEFGYAHSRWYTKDSVHIGPNKEGYPRKFQVDRHIIEYDEAVYMECERRFKEIKEHHERFDQFKEEMKLPGEDR